MEKDQRQRSRFSGQQVLTACVFKPIAILNNTDKGKTNFPALLGLTFYLQIARQIKWRETFL